MLYLTEDEIRRLLAAVDVKAPMGPRDYFLVVFAYHTGLRVSELAGLNVQDVAHNGVPRQTLHLVAETAKGKKSRLVPLNDVARLAVAKLLAFNAKRGLSVAPEAPLFQNRYHERIPVRTIQFVVAHLRDKAGLDVRATPHSLRHSFATHLTALTGDVSVTQELLGHQKLSSTQVYLHPQRDRLACATQLLAKRKPTV